MGDFLNKTAWVMTPPRPYGTFHLIFTVLGLAFAVLAAYGISKKFGRAGIFRTFFACGVLLGASELYKQLFLYYVVNKGVYDWWYFPFQLCSIPMYLCLLAPFWKGRRAEGTVCAFLMDYSLLGGIMALAEPSGLMHPYWTLTLHGMCWHIALLFIGLLAAFSKLADFSFRGYLRTLPMIGACCLAATVINMAARPAGQADMFYISPFYANSQMVFHQFAVKFGITAGNLLYIAAMCLGGLVIHALFGKIFYYKFRRIL